jgi:Flp pilus assembly protein TadG
MFPARGNKRRRLKGQIMAMTALMVPVLMAGALISTDTAVLVTGRAQMQAMADAGALAAAQQLADDARLSATATLSNEMSNARAAAIATGKSNKVLGSTPVIIDNPGNSSTGQIVIGYLSPTDYSSSAPNTGSSQSLFNSVQLQGIRDSTHGGIIPTFFGGPFGISGSNMTVTSTAIAYNATIKGFTSASGLTGSLLPIVLDQDTYNNMIAGSTTDVYTWDQSSGTVTAGEDGVHESTAYPVGTGDPGNWGTVKIGVANNSTSTLSSQIQYGLTPAQLATFPNGTIQLDYSQTPPQLTLNGNPGISAGVKSAIDAIIGRPVVIPIYDQTGDNGNNAWFRIVQFAAVRIMASNFQGNPKYVIVQPALVNDPTAIPGPPQPSWTPGGLIRIHLAR